MDALVDLHTHSSHSDGALAPEALVALAAQRGVGLLALTDHDTMAGCPAAAEACAQAGIEFIPGVELSCGWLGREIHVVGLEVDASHAGLADFLRQQLQRRRTRIATIGSRLAATRTFAGNDPAMGVLASGAVPTRTHLARAIVDLGLARDVQDAFDRHLGRGRDGHVPAEWPPLQAAVEIIHAANGIAVLAHAHRYRLSNGQLDALCAAFKAAGGKALEVGLAGLSPDDYARLARLARRHDLAGSVGSDFHEPGLPWRPLGRFDKLPEQVRPLTASLRSRQGTPKNH